MKLCSILSITLVLGFSTNLVNANETLSTTAETQVTSPTKLNTSGLSNKNITLKQPSLVPQILQVTLGLFLVLIIVGAAAWFARRFGQFNVAAKGSLRVVGGLHLGARERLVLVQVGDKQLLLGVAPGRVNNLYTLENPVTIEKLEATDESSFSYKLAKVIGRK